MRKIRVFMMIGLISSMLLTGCQKVNEQIPEDNQSGAGQVEENQIEENQPKENQNNENQDNGNQESEPENVKPEEAQTEDSQTGETTVDEEQNMAAASEGEAVELTSKDTNENDTGSKSDLISGFLILHKDNDYFGENYKGLVIGHNYEQLGLSEATKNAYPELYKAVLMVNDLIATDEANCYYADYRQAMKSDTGDTSDHPVSEIDWHIFVRRADKDVVSLLVEITKASYEDYNHVRYMSFNIKPDTGEIINLSDIIEDEDSLYDKLAQKFYEVMKSDEAGFFATSDITAANIARTLEESAYEDQLVWTLDPQGVSFWLSSMRLAPVSMNAKILFCEDDKGKIFTSDVRENIPDTWVTQLHPNNNELIDADDDGKQDTIYAMEILKFYEDSDSQYTSGIFIEYNGKEYEFPVEDDDYDYVFSLIHQNGKSMLLSQYKEYEADIQELYKLDEQSVESSDLLCGWVCGDPDESFTDFDEYSYVSPIMTDPMSFNMAITSWLLSTAEVALEYRITDDVKFKALSERGMLREGDRYEISTKIPMDGVPVVDSKTGEVTKETVDLESGAKLKLMFTDVNNYVDCLTENNKLVRINVFIDDDIGSCVKVNGENVSVQEAFDGMVYFG